MMIIKGNCCFIIILKFIITKFEKIYIKKSKKKEKTFKLIQKLYI